MHWITYCVEAAINQLLVQHFLLEDTSVQFYHERKKHLFISIFFIINHQKSWRPFIQTLDIIKNWKSVNAKYRLNIAIRHEYQIYVLRSILIINVRNWSIWWIPPACTLTSRARKRKTNFSLLRSDMESFHIISFIVFCRCRCLAYYKIVKRSNNYRTIHKSLRMPKRFQVSDYKVHKVSTSMYTRHQTFWETHASTYLKQGKTGPNVPFENGLNLLTSLESHENSCYASLESNLLLENVLMENLIDLLT